MMLRGATRYRGGELNLRFGSWGDWYRLLRVDKPVGYWLLLWPTLWGLLAASKGQPNPENVSIFVAGVVLMRSAGCVINDFADRDFDPHVARTSQRPLATGVISASAALFAFVVMLLLALWLAWQLPADVLGLAVVGAVLASLYPFLKRFTHFPQAWLGMAFGWGGVMAWGVEHGTVLDSPIPWMLFVANIFWSLSYDTAYALADREDDLKIGVKSTAIWLGERAVGAVVALGVLMLLLLGGVALLLHSFWVWLGLCAATALQLRLSMLLLQRGEAWGFYFFLHSHWVGALFVTGLALQGLFG